MKEVLVAYYSAEGHTKRIAEEIAKDLNADLFEIVPDPVYSKEDLDWTNDNSRVSREYHNENLRDVKLKKNTTEYLDKYDTIFLGYPIWWGIAAWPINTFIENSDLQSKRIIPFAVSHSSGLGESAELLKQKYKDYEFTDARRFSQDATYQEIDAWVNSLNA